MARVRPLYLSRTYGVPLPNQHDQTQGWDPEEFLDKLARKKGRLLRQGEPDLDSVAKIVLSDWVRGRIPFFVAPPERPEELNLTEAKARAKAARDMKAKGKTSEDSGAPSVKQNLGSIMQKNTFLPEDVRPLQVPADTEVEKLGSQGEEDVSLASENGDDDSNDDLQWADVFEGITKEGLHSSLEEHSEGSKKGI